MILAAAAYDIVCTTTSSSEPVLCGEWIRPGTMPTSSVPIPRPPAKPTAPLIASGRLYVDSLASALAEAGDILIPIAEGVVGRDHVVGELGALLLGHAPGRASIGTSRSTSRWASSPRTLSLPMPHT